ncbi:MAG: PEP-utilizing enzyme [Desulforhopalus sp.]|nr:PEP-utilizing enzyme [Desulforhopalus sp.]
MPFLKMFQSGNTCEPLPSMDAKQRSRYEHFRELLLHNRTALSTIADLEQLYYNNRPFTLQLVERKIGSLLTETEKLISSLAAMSAEKYDDLHSILNSIRRSIQDELAGDESFAATPFTLPLETITKAQSKVTGAKAANLAHMGSELAIPTPRGFSLTTSAYWYFMKDTGLIAEIDEALATMIADDPNSLEETGDLIRRRILATPLPAAILRAIDTALQGLTADTPSDLHLAVRSSAVGEDGEVSFAGQYTSVLNVPLAGLAEAYKEVVASKYSAAALSYRMHHGLDDLDTPMAVLVIEMLKPRLSGVLYTADPQSGDHSIIRVSCVEGLGEDLVGGHVSPQHSYRLGKESFKILPATTEDNASPTDLSFLRELWIYALRLEEHFQRPLDMEWAVDGDDHLFLLQVRPLLVSENAEEEPAPAVDYPQHPILIDGGKCAASGIATGQVVVFTTGGKGMNEQLGPDTILVSRSASTMLTPWVGKVKGIITDIGSSASHLASVAREFGVPALFDTQTATTVLQSGETVTLWASNKKVYKGNVLELTAGVRPIKRPIFASPAHLRMQHLLDFISPLTLTDAAAPDFRQEKCRSIHDIIRYCHEFSVRKMFQFGEVADRERNAVQLKVSIPIRLFALDLGGGFRPGLTTCSEINAHEVSSIPFCALWRGLSHPGVNWSSSVAVGAHNFMALLAGGVQPQQSQLGGASYTLVSNDYMNLSIRFGYHFATVDALITDDPEVNYAALHFTGGAGAYSGKSLRIQYIAAVLSRLGFAAVQKGDLIEASLNRLDRPAMETTLEQLGCLLGSTRLLDMALRDESQVEYLIESFFKGHYNFLEQPQKDAPEDFYPITGMWRQDAPGMENGILQDGSHFASSLTSGINQSLGRFLGQRRYIEILDNIEAYHYFPLAIAKKSKVREGTIRVAVKPLSGVIDQAGGLAFAIRDWANYFVLRINALEHNAVLFEFKNGKRLLRAKVDVPIISNRWYNLAVAISGSFIKAFLEERQVLGYEADRDLQGYVGLWTKADSVTMFKDLTVQ